MLAARRARGRKRLTVSSDTNSRSPSRRTRVLGVEQRLARAGTTPAAAGPGDLRGDRPESRLPRWITMSQPRSERLAPQHRMRPARMISRPSRGAESLIAAAVVFLPRSPRRERSREPGWIASKRGVVWCRTTHRARRRLREIVRRRCRVCLTTGFLLVFIASRASPPSARRTRCVGLRSRKLARSRGRARSGLGLLTACAARPRAHPPVPVADAARVPTAAVAIVHLLRSTRRKPFRATACGRGPIGAGARIGRCHPFGTAGYDPVP